MQPWQISTATAEQIRHGVSKLNAEMTNALPWEPSVINLACVGDDEAILGVIQASTAGSALLISALWVVESERGNGVGSALLAELLNCLPRDVRDVYVTCVSGRAQAFYGRHAFTPVMQTSLGSGVEFLVMTRCMRGTPTSSGTSSV